MFPKTQINAHTIIAAKDTVDIITQPYNNILGMVEGNSLVDSRYCYDNQTMGGNIRHIMKAAFKPTDHSSMNHMIAMVFSSLTSSPRFMGSDTEPTMGVNLTPFPALCLVTKTFQLQTKVIFKKTFQTLKDYSECAIFVIWKASKPKK